MTLYLIRHGIAEETTPPGGDAERHLTRQGTLRTAIVAKGIAQVGLHFDRMISSPFVRARESAEIIARVTGHEQAIVLDERLVPNAAFEDVCSVLAENGDVEHLAFVGHEPCLSRTISGLCADGRLSVDVKKASVTAITIRHLRPPSVGTLLWSVTPKLFERLVS